MRRVQFCCWSVLFCNLLGCSICCTPYDDYFAAYGGLYERANMTQGRVGSLFDPAPLVTKDAARGESNLDLGSPSDGTAFPATSSDAAAGTDRQLEKNGEPKQGGEGDFEKRLQQFLPDTEPLPAIPEGDDEDDSAGTGPVESDDSGRAI